MNHYKFLDLHLPKFFGDTKVHGGFEMNAGIIGAHGDKFYGYKSQWEHVGIHFFHGCMIGMLTYVSPYGKECRIKVDGEWIDPGKLVIQNYERFKEFLPEIKENRNATAE